MLVKGAIADSSFCRRHIQMHFRDREFLYLSNFADAYLYATPGRNVLKHNATPGRNVLKHNALIHFSLFRQLSTI